MKYSLVTAFTLLGLQTSPALAATMVMNNDDTAGATSFNTGLNWTGGAVPVAGNAYQTATHLLRTPANGTAITFAGDSLEIQSGGNLRDKTTAAVTINNLILDDGSIFDMSGAGGSLAGKINLNSGISAISIGGGDAFTCSSVISGTGGFNTYNAVSTGGFGTNILTGVNTFTGPTIVNFGTLVLNHGNAQPSTLYYSSGLTINTNGTVQVGLDNSLTGSSGTIGVLPVTINAGGLLTGSPQFQSTAGAGTSTHIRGLLTLNGGILSNSGTSINTQYGAWDLDNGVAVNTGPNYGVTSAISCLCVVPSQAGGTYFNINAGGTPNGIDLLVSGTLINGSSYQDTGIIKTGSGVMALTGVNTFGGGLSINGGTLQLGTANDTAPLTSPAGTGGVTNNATLNFASSQTVTVSNVISGSGAVTVTSGTAILTASNTYSGATTVASGGILGGTGSIAGNVTVSGKTLPSINTNGATSTFEGNLTYNYGAEADFHLATNATGGSNDQIVLTGVNSVLNCGSAKVGIYLASANLDEANDYILFNLTGATSGVAGNFIATPVWLGATPTDAGSFSIVTVGSKVLLHYNSNGVTNLPVVANIPATNVSFTSATLNGQLISSGGQFPAVTIYYGTSDGGTNSANWPASVSLGLQSGSFSATVSNLMVNTTYYYTAIAANSAGTAWATPSQSFTTSALIPATVTNLPAANVQGSSAILNGAVLSIGNQTPAVTLYYGPMDGGTNAGAWSNSIYLGQQTGNFSVTITGLTTNTVYYYAVAAANNAGTAWTAPSLNFMTLLNAPVVSVLTYHNDNARDGANTNETLLTPGTVNTNNFGRLMTYPVDAFVFAQPLYVANLAIPGQSTHNVVFIATENDSIYAFDADNNTGANGGLLWSTNLGIAPLSNNKEFGGRYHNNSYIDLTPEVGITGTPVIDPVSGTLYVDVLSREVSATTTNYYHRIHALNVTNGTEQSYSPVVVTGSVPGKGVSGNGSTVTFNPQQEAQRPALTLAGGQLYVAYGSFADTDPYHGWIMGFNATNLVQQTNYIFNTTPNATISAFGSNAGEGALWMGGDGLCVDTNNNLYFEVANGSFSQNTNGGDYGDSFVRLSTASQLTVADYFTPYNQAAMQSSDSDLGSGGPLLLPDTVGSAAHPHLLVGGGKAGIMFLVDRDNMGTYSTTVNNIVQQVSTGMNFFSTPAYFNYHIYYQGHGNVMNTYIITNGYILPTPTSTTTTSFAGFGTTPSISANGTNNGIVWSIQTDGASPSDAGAGVLHAYNATNLTQELYNSSQNFARDNPGPGVKYSVPTVANGKVYVGAQYQVSVYGYTAFLATPTISPNGLAFTNSVLVTLADATPGAVIYYTLDGSQPTTNSILYNGPFTVTSTLNVQATAVKSGAVNSGLASASFINTAASGSGIGLSGQYWTNTSSTAFTNVSFNTPPTLTRTDAVVNFNWSTVAPDPTIGQTNFTVRWTGCVQPQYDETYSFITTADDGVRLYLNGRLLIDDWVDKTSATSKTNSLTLAAQQFYNIELDYYQKTNNASAALSWSSPSTLFEIIPETQLYPFTNPLPTVILTSPANSSSYTAAASVTVGAEADAPYNPVSFVSFYANGVLLGSVSNAPYSLTATGLAAGSYALTAVAVDGSGLSSTSIVANITVNSGSGQPYGLTSNAPVAAFLNMPTTFNGTLPPLLSETGAFADTPDRVPAGGLIPYNPNVILWSDNAIKSRYLAVPNIGGTLTPDQQINFLPTNSWTFPAGSVFVKNFDLTVNETNPAVPLRRLETRLLVRDINGAVYGVTYKWRPDNSDADLLASSLSENILITNATGVRTQTWYYPSPSDCLLCHTPQANYVLGLNTRQLNRDQTYPSTGVTDNQLRTLNRLGLFNPTFDESAITNFEKLFALTNLTASLQDRTRSYLDANCAMCHQPGGTGITFDGRYDTPLAQQNITNYPASFNLGYDNACIVKSQDVWRSMIWQRMNTTNNTYKMPTLARALIDTNAVQVLTDWINSLPGTPALAPPVITPNGGSFVASVSVTLTAPDTNATVYYTLDGSLPTTNSLRYTGAFNLLGNATVSANAFETNYDNSVAASAPFAVEPLHFTSAGFTNNIFQMGFMGATGSNYVLQASTNFSTWTSISTNIAVTNLFDLFDAQATNYPYRFYRVLRQ